MTFTEIPLTGALQGALLKPERPNGLGIIVITGSSGRVDVARAALFAQLGVTAIAQRWWGGEGQAKGINLIPLEVFSLAVERLLAEGCERIAMLGTSYGAEAVLAFAVREPRLSTAIAISPTAVIWQNNGPGLDGMEWPPRSSLTWRDQALPCIVLDPRAWPTGRDGPPAYRGLHEASLRTFAEDVPAATIRIEEAAARVILVAGASDALWPSNTAARSLAARLTAAGRDAIVVEHPEAGHSPVFPGEQPPAPPTMRAWGGTPEADRALGEMAWAAITTSLGIEG